MARRKIAIVGTAPSWKDAPFDDKSWQIWSFNRSGFRLPRWDVLFEIHQRFEDHPEDDKHLEKLRTVKPPKKIYSLKRLADPSVNIVIDRTELRKRHRSVWLSSSITYAMAFAIDQKPREIGLWGIDMESREEYVVQFAGCVHFLDICRERGIKTYLPDGCMLLRDPVPYPDRFETAQAVILEKRAQRIKKMIEDVEGYVPLLHRLKGELAATQHYKRLFVWNALPPELGEETDAEIEDCGPI